MTSQASALTLSSRMQQASPSMTVAIAQRARGLQQQGKKIINIASGERDFDTPAGAFYLFVDCQKALNRATADGEHLQSDVQLAHYLLEEAGVATVPGSAFGQPGHLRLTFSLAGEDVFFACEKIVSVLEALQ
ncbi:aminotransferase class I/II-fold pyridoxal phosphate-dependent enzyme [Erwinia amylovora]